MGLEYNERGVIRKPPPSPDGSSTDPLHCQLLSATVSYCQLISSSSSISNLLNIETNKKVERYFAHVPSGVDTDQFEPLPVVGVVHQHVAIEEAHEVVQEEEDEKIVVHQFDEGGFPSDHQFEKARHPTGCVFILVLVDVVVPGNIFFVDRHHKTEMSTLQGPAGRHGLLAN